MSEAHLVKRIGYVGIGVADVDRATDFYERVGQLSLSERTPEGAFLTGGVEHHWLRLYKSQAPGDFRVGYEAVDAAALEEIAARLDARGIAYEEGGDLSVDRIDRSIRFRNPDGVELEIFTQMMELPTPPRQTTVKMLKLLHAVWSTQDVVAGYQFHADVLGFRDSDWLERRVVFLRCADGYHHSAGLAATPGPAALQHFCILVDTIDDVMRARNNALDQGAELLQDLLRHAASGSIGVYVKDPDLNFSVEFCTSHPQIEDEGYRARILPKSAVTSDLWQEKPPAAAMAPSLPLLAPALEAAPAPRKRA
ncbi:MAG: hypothetical protein JWL73_1600 [Actinomycetia bacterium]|nr:hypothetical protein [Actinomycetes bacterium]